MVMTEHLPPHSNIPAISNTTFSSIEGEVRLEYEYIDLVILASLRLCGIFLQLRRQTLSAIVDGMEVKAGHQFLQRNQHYLV